MNTNPKIAVLYHLFYEDSFENIPVELKPLSGLDATFFFNICVESPGKRSIAGYLKKNFPGCYIICTSNKGKDIGGKLALLQLFLELKTEADYFLFLHDKKSLQALKSGAWKKDLHRIIGSSAVPSILTHFRNNELCGIVATRDYVIPETIINGNFSGTNASILVDILEQYKLKPPGFEFVAGTMFWSRTKPLTDFFSVHQPLEIRSRLEDGNVLDNFSGTQTHSWERALSWIVTSAGYTIKGI